MDIALPIPTAAQTAYANLNQAMAALEQRRGPALLPGGFTQRGGGRYWYHQLKLPDGRVQQVYVGKESAELQALREAQAAGRDAPELQHVQRLSAAALALGCEATVPQHAMVIERLAQHGFFHAGGLLIGTHAFLAYQNLLGLRWQLGTATVDLDFAHPGRNLSLALPPDLRLDTHSAIESLRMGFVPNRAGTSYTKADEPDFELDFLTSIGRSGRSPLYLPQLNLRLRSVRFMEYSMQSSLWASLLSRRGPVWVRLPLPEHFALHKLLVWGERPAAQRPKARKDLAQAASLLLALQDQDAAALTAAWRDLVSRGAGWQRRFDAGLRALADVYPALPLRDFRR